MANPKLKAIIKNSDGTDMDPMKERFAIHVAKNVIIPQLKRVIPVDIVAEMEEAVDNRIEELKSDPIINN